MLSRYAETLPHEPTGFALKRAADDLRKQRLQMRIQVIASEREERAARAERRYPLMPSSRLLRTRIHELGAVVAWLEYRADMRGVL